MNNFVIVVDWLTLLTLAVLIFPHTIPGTAEAAVIHPLSSFSETLNPPLRRGKHVNILINKQSIKSQGKITDVFVCAKIEILCILYFHWCIFMLPLAVETYKRKLSITWAVLNFRRTPKQQQSYTPNRPISTIHYLSSLEQKDSNNWFDKYVMMNDSMSS